jgi:signal transduction histidine kinase
MTQPSPTGATSARLTENRQLATRVLAERCHLQARQALLEPAVGIPMICLVLVTLHPGVGSDQLVPWALLLSATLLLRSVCAGRFIARRRSDSADIATLTGVFNLTAGLTGLLIGACAGLFFAQVDHTDRLALTVLIFAWLALGVLTYAPFPRHALLHGGAVLAQLAVAWALAPNVPGGLIAMGVLLYGLLMWRLSTVLSRALLQSIRRKHRIRQLARRLEHQRQAAEQAGRSASRFLAAASHDLRQPATSLGLLCALIRERCQDPTVAPLIAAIDRAATTISELLASLLDLSQLESNTTSPKLEWLSVEQLFESLREEFSPRAAQSGLALMVVSAPVRILADRILLTRLLRNLLDNAIRFTDKGAITLAAAPQGGCILSVTDTGVGIAPEHLERIFDEHVRIASPRRRSPPGLGLGLAMVRRIAQLLEARVSAYSDGSSGSRFEIAFMHDRVAADDAGQAPETASVAPPTEPVQTPFPTEARALLVEDDPEVARALQSLLEARGWRCDVASDARDAFARLSARSDWSLLLTDYTLNGRPDGMALALAARLMRPRLACLLLSADTSADVQRHAVDHGLPLILKPVSEHSLLGAIQNLSAPPR